MGVPPDYGFDTSSPHDLRLGAQAILQAAVAEVIRDDPDLRVKLSAVQGHPVPVLLNAAKGASLLVMGSRGLGAFAGLLLGSVSTHCVTHATCPVTVVLRPIRGREPGPLKPSCPGSERRADPDVTPERGSTRLGHAGHARYSMEAVA